MHGRLARGNKFKPGSGDGAKSTPKVVLRHSCSEIHRPIRSLCSSTACIDWAPFWDLIWKNGSQQKWSIWQRCQRQHNNKINAWNRLWNLCGFSYRLCDLPSYFISRPEWKESAVQRILQKFSEIKCCVEEGTMQESKEESIVEDNLKTYFI